MAKITQHFFTNFVTRRCVRVPQLCDLEAHGLSGRLEEGMEKLRGWAQSRQLLVRWGANKWAEHHLLPHVPHLRPFAEPELTLRSALAPIEPWHLTRNVLRSAPGKVIALFWQFCLLWAARSLPLPARVSRRRRRLLAPTLMELASAYDVLVR